MEPTRSHGITTRLNRELCLLVFTIALTSVLCATSVCGSSDGGLQHVPTLKEIYGGVPKNSFPVVRRNSSRMLRSNPAALISESSVRRGLRSSEPQSLTIPVSDVGFSATKSVDSAYYAQLQIGTPPQDILLVIDTGSPYFWVQSTQCSQDACEVELLPTYNQTISSTFEPEIVNGSRVPWNAGYGAGFGNSGYKARETLTIDSGNGNQVVIPGFEFGVAINNTGNSYQFSGILGLSPEFPGAQLPPFLTQLETISNGTYSKFSKKFRYCFPDRVKQGTTTSFLSFGDIDESDTDSLFSSTQDLHKSKTLWTGLIPNGMPLNPSYVPFYAVNLTAVTVGGIRIPIDPQELTLESVQVNDTITIIDSGTDINQLREPYFSQFIDAFSNATMDFEGAQIKEYNVYYNISRDVFDGALFPSVSFIFQKWRPDGAQGEQHEEIEVFQSKDSLLIPVTIENEVFYLLNMSPAGGTQNIIGNYAQENFLIEFDLEKSRVGFLRASCTFEY